MKTYTLWQNAPISDRIEVYKAYLADLKKNEYYGFEDLKEESFEEFDRVCRFSTFKHIKSLYVKSA